MRDPEHPTKIGRLRRRADFVRAAKGQRVHGKGFTLQASRLGDTRVETRVGFTLTRKVGGAVVRNRARRRLKEAVRLGAGLPVEAGRDYVLIGRIDAIRMPFEQLRQDLARAFRDIRGEPGKRQDGIARSRDGKPGPQGPRPTA